jgi:hypothetical protein
MRRSIQIQRKPLAGRYAAQIAKKANPGLDALKQRYKKKYLEIKKKQQRIYGMRGLIMAKRH